MRQGRTFRRCTRCGARVPDRKCAKCGADSFSWAYVVDVAPVGSPKREQRTKAGFATKAAALEAMNALQAGKRDGTYLEPARLTLGEFLETWVRAGAGGVRPWTLRGYASVVRNHISPRLGSVPLQQLTRPQVKALYVELATTGRRKGRTAGSPLSPKSVHNIHICLRAALNDAIEDGLLRTNPATGALKPPKGGAEMVTWTREELATFLGSLEGTPDYPMWRVAAYTGLRRGELLGLRWTDVKWNLEQLSVQQQLGLDVDEDGERDLAPVKTGNGRRPIGLDSTTLAVLRDHEQAQAFERRRFGENYRDRDLVFCRPDGRAHDPDVITGRFESIVKGAGVRRIRLHDVRHTHATLLLEAGVDISVVSRRLGHADVGFTARVYAHVTERLQRDAAAKLSAYLEPVGQPAT